MARWVSFELYHGKVSKLWAVSWQGEYALICIMAMWVSFELYHGKVSKLWDISWQEQVTVWRDDDDNDFVLDQHFEVKVDSVIVRLVNMVRRVWRYQRNNQNPRRTDNTMAKRKSTKGETTIYKTYI